jgi:hypothetical protein
MCQHWIIIIEVAKFVHTKTWHSLAWPTSPKFCVDQ